MKKRSKANVFDMQKCIRDLVACSPRQFEGEKKALAYILAMLDRQSMSYKIQNFQTMIPIVDSVELCCDGETVEAEACCYISGTIENKDVVLSSAMPSRYCSDIPNINFNPNCPVFSPGNHYFAPAVTVTHRGLRKVLAASDVRGEVSIRKIKHTSANVLVGNAISPTVLCFAHYDSIKTGAIDNASGVAVLLATLAARSDLTKNCLFVFAGNEELSYDRPTYWGHGFRILEKKYPSLFQRARKIITVDCVGNGMPQLITDIGIVSRAFPLVNAQSYVKKTVLLTGNFKQLMTVYHSEHDDGRGITKGFLDEAKNMLLNEISLHI